MPSIKIKKYKVSQNTIYILKGLKEFDPHLPLFLLAGMFFSAVAMLLPVVIPKILLDLLTSKAKPEIFIIHLAVLGVTLATVQGLDYWINQTQIVLRMMRVRFGFKNVWFSYPQAAEGKWPLKDVNLVIEYGEKLSIVGKNGAGKTTLIKLLCRLYDPDKGEILLDGINIKKYGIENYLKLFGVVFQDYRFFGFTVKENLLGIAAWTL